MSWPAATSESGKVHSRRQWLTRASLGALSLPGWLMARQSVASVAAPAGLPPLRSCILLFQYGGPSHIDTFDLKPDAPLEVRGEFRPIATSVPGLNVCEHLPMLARVMDRIAIVRSLHHTNHLHDPASIETLTGRPPPQGDQELFSPFPQVFPSYGSLVTYCRRQLDIELPHAALPFVFHNVVPTPCQGGGFLGQQYDPFRIDVDPATRSYRAGVVSSQDGVTPARRAERRGLLDQLDARCDESAESRSMRGHFDRAFRLLASPRVLSALDLTKEDPLVRERYGFDVGPSSVGEGGGGGNGAELGHAREMRGQNLLVARRLVEAGVPFINVYDFRQQGQNWDAHFKCFNQHKTFLLPIADRSISALIEDLDARGLLETTLIVVVGEFGRTPRINRDGGRDHWPDCYSALLAGGGVRGGAIHGSSDRFGAYPASDPVTPADLAATIFWRFGIDPATEVRDAQGRPFAIAAGQPMTHLFG